MTSQILPEPKLSLGQRKHLICPHPPTAHLIFLGAQAITRSQKLCTQFISLGFYSLISI